MSGRWFCPSGSHRPRRMLREAEAAGWTLLTSPASEGCCVEQEVRDVQGTGQGGGKHTGKKLARRRKRAVVMEPSRRRRYEVDQKEDFRFLHVARGYRMRVNNRWHSHSLTLSAQPQCRSAFDLPPAFLSAKPLGSPPPVSAERMMWGEEDDKVLSDWMKPRNTFSLSSAGRWTRAETGTGDLDSTLAALLNLWRLSVNGFCCCKQVEW